MSQGVAPAGGEGDGALDPAVVDDSSISFNASLWAQLSLPYTDPGDVPGWVRTNGMRRLVVTPGADVGPDGKAVSLGIPFGNIPRHILILLATEALRTGSPLIDVGSSMRRFMGNLGMSYSSGRTGSAHRVTDQMRRLFNASIHVRAVTDTDVSHREVAANMRIASGSEFVLWKNRSGDSSVEGMVELSPEYFAQITEHSVPLDTEMLRRLSKAQPIDLYTWLTYRRFGVRRATLVPWESLAQQFGAEYKRLADFRRKTRVHLATIQALWPELKIGDSPKGLTIYPGAPHVRAARRYDPVSGAASIASVSPASGSGGGASAPVQQAFSMDGYPTTL